MDNTTDTNIGRRLGNYVIEAFLAEGGMSRVYTGRHNKLNRLVAVKVLKPALADQEHILWRFENEALAMEKLRGCPDIINVIDFHEEGNFRAIIMELLVGSTLKDLIKKGAVSEAETTQIFTRVLSAFGYAHERNVVHRDVKPSNIFLLDNGEIRVLDFGIAKIANSGEEFDYTATGTQMGTLIYMSPEQVLDSKHVDHCSDIYSLGVTLYHCLTGLAPYNQETLSRFEIQRRIVYEPIDGTQTLAEPYRSIIEKCTAKKPENRFQSCKELKSALLGVSGVTEQGKETPQPKPDPIPEIQTGTVPKPVRDPEQRISSVADLLKLMPNRTSPESDGTILLDPFQEVPNETYAAEAKWMQVKALNKAEAYREFIKSNPQSKYLTEANALLEKIESDRILADKEAWQNACMANSINAYTHYKLHFQNGKYVAEADAKITQLGLWEKAKSENSEEAVKKYLLQYPSDVSASEFLHSLSNEIESAFKIAIGSKNLMLLNSFVNKYPLSNYASEAEREIQKIEWSIASNKRTTDAVNDYLMKYKTNAHFYHEAVQLKKSIQSEQVKLEFDNALQSKNLPGLIGFLKKHPDSPFEAEVQRQIEKLEWELAEKENSIVRYVHYIEKYPQGAFVATANKAIQKIKEAEEDAFWKNTLRSGTIDVFKKYIASYQKNGRYIRDAEIEIEKIFWNSSCKENTITSYSNYLAKYPDGKFKADADSKIAAIKEKLRIADENFWLKTQATPSCSNLNEYLSVFKNPIHGNEAKQLLEKLEAVRRKKLKRWILGIAASIVFAIFFVIVIPTESDYFDKAYKVDTIEAYELFLSKYPNSSHKDFCYSRIYNIAQSKSIDKLQEMLDKYPGQFGSAEAEQVLKDHYASEFELALEQAIQSRDDVWNMFYVTDKEMIYNYAPGVDKLISITNLVVELANNMYLPEECKLKAVAFVNDVFDEVKTRKNAILHDLKLGNNKYLNEKLQQLNRFEQNAKTP